MSNHWNPPAQEKNESHIKHNFKMIFNIFNSSGLIRRISGDLAMNVFVKALTGVW